MNDPSSPIRQLPRLDPPPGGEQRLRQRLAESGSFWSRPWLAAGSVALLFLALLLGTSRRGDVDEQIWRAVRAAGAPGPEIEVAGYRTVAVPTSDPRVRIYFLADEPARRSPSSG